VITETISNLDWYPTLVAMAGAELPKGETIRGRNFLPLLKGQKLPGWNNDFYAEYSVHNTMKAHMRMFRTPHWKLVRNFLEPERDELYDLKNDPDEMDNRFDDPACSGVRRELEDMIAARPDDARKALLLLQRIEHQAAFLGPLYLLQKSSHPILIQNPQAKLGFLK